MIIVDTNVVSELLRPTPEPRVEGWLAAQDGLNIYLTAISEAELRDGIGTGEALTDAVDRILREDMSRRILSFDSEAAEPYAATRWAAGRPIAPADYHIPPSPASVAPRSPPETPLTFTAAGSGSINERCRN